MGFYTVDAEAVLTATGMVRASAYRIQSDTATMLGHLTHLQSTWTGTAATAFQTVIDQWRTAHHAVEESLETISHALEAAGHQYAETEQATASLFR